MTREDINAFEKLVSQIEGLYGEIAVLAKKSPNDALNSFKIKFVNSAIQRCNELFGDPYRPFEDFDGFASDDLPSNSDVTLMLSQYIECAEKFRADNIVEDEFGGGWHWKIKGEKIVTGPPKKIKR